MLKRMRASARGTVRPCAPVMRSVMKLRSLPSAAMSARFAFSSSRAAAPAVETLAVAQGLASRQACSLSSPGS